MTTTTAPGRHSARPRWRARRPDAAPARPPAVFVSPPPDWGPVPIRGWIPVTPDDAVAVKVSGRDTAPFRAAPRYTPTPPPAPAAPEWDFAWWVPGPDGRPALACGYRCGNLHADPDAFDPGDPDPDVLLARPCLFDWLRQTARTVGWKTDMYGRWACPACQDQIAFRLADRPRNLGVIRGRNDGEREWWDGKLRTAVLAAAAIAGVVPLLGGGWGVFISVNNGISYQIGTYTDPRSALLVYAWITAGFAFGSGQPAPTAEPAPTATINSTVIPAAA